MNYRCSDGLQGSLPPGPQEVAPTRELGLSRPDLTLLLCPGFAEVELPLKKDGLTSESTTLEALLRGEAVEKKVDTREEESIQEIQVFLPTLPRGGGAARFHLQNPGDHPCLCLCPHLPLGTWLGNLKIYFRFNVFSGNLSEIHSSSFIPFVYSFKIACISRVFV